MSTALRHAIALSLACAVFISPVSTIAEQPGPLKRLETGDDTRGWEAVGRLNLGDTGFCTGALISDTLVLTAAHCLYDSNTGERVAAEEIEFLAGLRAGRAEAYRGVRRAVAHPDYVFGETVELNRVAVDLALLELDRPVRTGRIIPFATSYGPVEGEPVGVVSYAKDRAEAPSLQRECYVLEMGKNVAMLSCSVDFGASGAPVFRFGAAGPSIVSVVSAKADADGEHVSLASGFGERFEELRNAFEAATQTTGVGGIGAGSAMGPQGGPVANVRRFGVDHGDASSAKFLRP